MRKTVLLIAILCIASLGLWWLIDASKRTWISEPIKVGVIHSLTGPMAINESHVVDATLMAIDEINSSGGLLGRTIKPIIIDGKSDPETFAKEAENLIKEDNVQAIFGGWTSASRKSMKPIIEENDSLLIYPFQYAGIEKSPNILYTGSSPNQQVIPTIKWIIDHLGNRFFLLGSDDIYSHITNAIIKDQISILKGEVVGESYIAGNDYNQLNRAIEEIKISKPSVIINNIDGDDNKYLFKKLREAGIRPATSPVFSFNLTENEVWGVGIENMIGEYSAWSYFQSIDNPRNKKFVSDFKDRYGSNRTINDPMESAYFSVYLWAQAVERAGTADPEHVIEALKFQSFNAPEGIVSIESKTMHTWKRARIGKIKPDGQFEIVWTSEYPIRPNPYPPTRSISEWNQFLQNLYESWGNHWVSPSQQKANETNKTLPLDQKVNK